MLGFNGSQAFESQIMLSDVIIHPVKNHLMDKEELRVWLQDVVDVKLGKFKFENRVRAEKSWFYEPQNLAVPCRIGSGQTEYVNTTPNTLVKITYLSNQDEPGCGLITNSTAQHRPDFDHIGKSSKAQIQLHPLVKFQ